MEKVCLFVWGLWGLVGCFLIISYSVDMPGINQRANANQNTVDMW